MGLRRQARLAGKTPRSIWGGYTMRLWLMIGLLAGGEGLPGAEDILNLLDPICRRLFGKSARQYLRENIKEFGEFMGLDVNPSLVTHGVMHDLPLPGANVNISRSMGFGKLVPGTDMFQEGATAIETAAHAMFSLMGPMGGIASWGVQSLPIFSDRSFEESMKRAPGMLGAASNAISWMMHGAKDARGASLLTDEKGNPIDPSAGQIFWRGMGFQISEIAERREKQFAQLEAKRFWGERRARLLKDWTTAMIENDREAVADANAAIMEFNSELPTEYRGIVIRGEQRKQATINRRREIQARESGVPVERMYRGLYREIAEDYE
jgi:hypothetical protein